MPALYLHYKAGESRTYLFPILATLKLLPQPFMVNRQQFHSGLPAETLKLERPLIKRIQEILGLDEFRCVV